MVIGPHTISIRPTVVKECIHSLNNGRVRLTEHPTYATHKATKTTTFFKHPLEIKGPKVDT
jgi:hypothetical protein